MRNRTASCTLRRLATGGLVLGIALLPGVLGAQEKARAVDLGSGNDPQLEQLTGEDALPLQITGFGVGEYQYQQRTGENAFRAGKLAVSVFREISDRVWLFGQLTTALASGEDAAVEPGEEVPTEIEIDNLLVSFTPGGGSGLSLSVGKFDVPLGFERDDEPLNFDATGSFNFELGRPVKLVGAVGRWSVSPSVDVTAMVGNGWNAQLDSNHGKTGGARLGLFPTETSSFGIGALIGPEGEQGEAHDRWVLTADYALEPGNDWIVAGEANWGGERGVRPDDGDASWYGGTLTVFRRLGRNFGAALRGETFRDADGARTGDVQTLQSLTFTPIYFMGAGREGIFANVERTTFRIPRLQVRAEARLDRSSIDAFETEDGASDWRMRWVLQLVTVF